MLGQPISMLIPEVIGFRLSGKLKEGVTATDLVLTVTEMLRKKGVVGKFVEFYGAGLSHLSRRGPRHHRQHGAGVWRNLRLLPRRQGHHRLSQGDRPRRRPRRAGRSLLQGAGPVPHRRDARPGVHRRARTRPRRGRALARRPEAPAGPRRARRRRHLLRRRARQDARHRRRRRGLRHGRGGRRLDAGTDQERARRRQGLPPRRRRRGDRRDHVVHQHVEPERPDRRRASGQERPREGPDHQAVGEDLAGARARRW